MRPRLGEVSAPLPPRNDRRTSRRFIPASGGSFSLSSPGLRHAQLVSLQRAPRSKGGGAGAAGAVEVVALEEEESDELAAAAPAGGGGVEAQAKKPNGA